MFTACNDFEYWKEFVGTGLIRASPDLTLRASVCKTISCSKGFRPMGYNDFSVRFCSIFFVWAIGWTSTVAWANEPPDRYGDVPSDSLAVASIDLKSLRESPEAKLIPWEIVEVACREQMGISFESIDSVDVTVGMPSPAPEVGFSFRLNQALDIADLKNSLATPVERSPKDSNLRFRTLIEFPMMRVAQREDRRVLVGTEGTLRRMLSPRLQPGGPMVQLVQSSQAPIRMALNFERIRGLVAVAFEQAAANVPESMRDDIEDVIRLIDNVSVEMHPMSDEALRVSFGTASGPNANSLMECMDRLRAEGMKITAESMKGELEKDKSLSDEMRTAVFSYSDRMQNVFDAQELWSVKEDRVHLKIENSMTTSYATVGVMTGLLLPAVQAAREAARRMSSSNNLKQIMLSLWNYESTYKKMPGRIVMGKDGKPLLSWRVMILPYLEETQLYNEFHLDEPWDSEHNIRLLERMPAVFSNPRIIAPPGHTVYLAPAGEGTWPEDALRLIQITDGTSNTIALVEARGELAVPWTKPDDFDIRQMKDNSWMPPGPGTHVAMFDGSVRFMSSFIDFETLRSMFTINGGEVVHWEAVAP